MKKKYIVPKTVDETVRLGIAIMVNIGAGSADKEPVEGDVKAWNDEFEMDDIEQESFNW